MDRQQPEETSQIPSGNLPAPTQNISELVEATFQQGQESPPEQNPVTPPITSEAGPPTQDTSELAEATFQQGPGIPQEQNPITPFITSKANSPTSDVEAFFEKGQETAPEQNLITPPITSKADSLTPDVETPFPQGQGIPPEQNPVTPSVASKARPLTHNISEPAEATFQQGQATPPEQNPLTQSITLKADSPTPRIEAANTHPRQEGGQNPQQDDSSIEAKTDIQGLSTIHQNWNFAAAATPEENDTAHEQGATQGGEGREAEAGEQEEQQSLSSFASIFAKRCVSSSFNNDAALPDQATTIDPPVPDLSTSASSSFPSIFGKPSTLPSVEEQASVFEKPSGQESPSLFVDSNPPVENDGEAEGGDQDEDFGLNASGVTASTVSDPFPSPTPPTSPLNEEPFSPSPSRSPSPERSSEPSAADQFFAAMEKKRKAQESHLQGVGRKEKPSIRDLGVIINSKMRPRMQKHTIGLSSAWQDHDNSGTYDPDLDFDLDDSPKRRRKRKGTGKGKKKEKEKEKEREEAKETEKGKQEVIQSVSSPSLSPSSVAGSKNIGSGSQKSGFSADDEMTDSQEGEEREMGGEKSKPKEKEAEVEVEVEVEAEAEVTAAAPEKAKRKSTYKPRMEHYSQQLKRKDRERRERSAAMAAERRKRRKLSAQESLDASTAPPDGFGGSTGLYRGGKTTKKQQALARKAARNSSSASLLPAGRTASGRPLRTVTTSFCYPLTFNWKPKGTGPSSPSSPSSSSSSSSPKEKEQCDWCVSPFFGLCGYGETTVTLAEYMDEKKQFLCEEIENGHSESGKLPSNMCVRCTFIRCRIMTCVHEHIQAISGLDAKTFNEKALYESLAAFADGDVEKGKLANETKWCSICPAPAFFACCAEQKFTSSGDMATPENRVYGCGLLLCTTCADLTKKIWRDHTERTVTDRIVSAAKGSVLGEYDESGIRADADFLLQDGELWKFMARMDGKAGNSIDNPVEIDEGPKEYMTKDLERDENPDSWDA